MSNTSRTLVSLVAGAVAGAVAALLLAPGAGEETRRKISDSASKARTNLNDTLQQGLDRIQSMGNNARSEAENGFDHLANAANMAKNDGKQQIKRGVDSI